MKKRYIALIIIAVALVSFIIFSHKDKEADVTDKNVDPFDYIVVEVSGYEGNGQIQISKVDIDDEKTAELFDTVFVEADKTYGLSNGDEILLSLTWDEKLADKYDVVFSRDRMNYTVSGLENAVGKYKGIDVPSYLSDEEKEIYYQNMVESQKNENKELSDLEVDSNLMYFQGTSEEKTELTNKLFSTTEEAYDYGMGSSQKFYLKNVNVNDRPYVQCVFVD